MRRILPLLLLALIALAACQKSPENFVVKDSDFGIWAEFVERWNGKMPGITGIGDPQQPDAEERFARPVWHADSSGYVVDFGYGTTLKAILKDGHVVRFYLAYAGGENLGFQRFSQGVGKAVVVAGVAARWDEPTVLRVANAINQSGPQSRTIIEGDYALNIVQEEKPRNLSLAVGRK
jgi:hypothetical protein